MDVSSRLQEVEKKLLGPGGMFQLEEEVVLGERMRVFKNRARSLIELMMASESRGDAEYIVFTDGAGERRITFAEHARLVAKTAAVLKRQFGVERGDRVAILAANCAEWLITFWATVSLGAVAVGLNAWWTGPEILFAVHNSAPKLLVLDKKRMARLSGTEPGVPTLVIEDEFARLLEEVPHAIFPPASVAEDDPALILFTSGTTGRPKGAVHSHRNVIALVGLGFFNGMRIRAIHPPQEHAPCVLVTSPLFHVSGLHNAGVACLAAGIKSVWLVGRFDPALALRVIEKERVTCWGYSATLLHRTVQDPNAGRHDLSSLCQLGGGGSPIAPALQKRARETFGSAAATLSVGYGLTECTSLATLNPGEELLRYPESVGRPMPTVEVEVRDSSGRRLPDGAEGEIHVRGPVVMLEYWRNQEATDEVILPGRWLKTGDIGVLRDGRLYLASRKRDLILRGGENVYPAEIEQRLQLHPDVAEVAVIGVDHVELGQEVKAVVVPVDGRPLEVEKLRAWVSEALAYFKVPAHWEVRSEPLPRNAMGKILKHVLQEGEASPFVSE